MLRWGETTAVAILLASVTTFVCGQSQTPPSRPPDAIAMFKTKGRFIRVPVVIGQESYLFVVDTGSSITLVDSSLIPLLGPSVGTRVVNGGGEVTVGIHDRPKLTIGDSKLRQMTIDAGGAISSADLSKLRSMDSDVYGIIGMDLMCNWTFMVSFDKNLVGIWQRHPDNPRAEGQSIPIQFALDGCPLVEAEIENENQQLFLIDTGAMLSVALPLGQYNGLLSSGRFVETNTTSFVSLGGIRTQRLSRTSRFSLASFTHDGLVVQSHEQAAIGLYYWRRYRVVFDFPRRTMTLANGKSYSYPDVSDRDGIQIELKDGNVILSAPPESLGYQAGIRDGDIVKSINGVPVRETGGGVARLLAMNDIGSVSLTVVRGGAELEVILPRPWSDMPTRGE